MRSEIDGHKKSVVNRRNLLKSGGGVVIAALVGGCLGTQQEGSGSNSSGSSNNNATEGQVGTQTIDVGQLTNFADVSREMAKQWNEIGVDFEIKTSTWGPYVPRVYSDEGNFEDAAHTPWGSSPDRIDPNFFLSTYTSDSSLNISGYSNDKYDELFKKQQAAYDEKERNKHITEMQSILRKDLPELTVVWPKATLPVNSAKWDIQPTKFIGARTTGTMTVLTAKPAENTQQLVVGAQQELSAPNPLAPSSNDVQYLFKYAYDTPRRIGLDGTAKNWAVNNFENVNKTTIDMTLRDSQKWHDGEDVTIEDLKFTFDFLTQYSFPKFDPYLDGVKSTSKQTDQTLRVNLNQPNVAFFSSAMSFMNILPKHIWEKVPDKVDKPVNYNMPVKEMVGSGPLKITNKSTDELSMVRFDDHFNPPNFKEFVFVNRPSTEAIRSDFEQQNIHMTTSSPPPSVTSELAKNKYIEESTAPSVLQMKYSFNLNEKPFSDVAFRKAILQASDAEKLSAIFYNGKVNQADGTLIHPAQKWGKDDVSDIGTANIEKAKSTLKNAGYSYDSNGNLQYPSSK